MLDQLAGGVAIISLLDDRSYDDGISMVVEGRTKSIPHQEKVIETREGVLSEEKRHRNTLVQSYDEIKYSYPDLSARHSSPKYS